MKKLIIAMITITMITWTVAAVRYHERIDNRLNYLNARELQSERITARQNNELNARVKLLEVRLKDTRARIKYGINVIHKHDNRLISDEQVIIKLRKILQDF